MDSERDRKRKKDKHRDDDYGTEKQSRKPRSRSPDDRRERESRRKRRHSRSRSPNIPLKHEKQNDQPPKDGDAKTKIPERKIKDTDMLNTRTGGAYIPPARLRMMQAQITDKSSIAYQRLAWEALKKSIHGHINKINVGNIGIIIKELLRENIVRGRGLLSRSIIQAQAASPTFTNVYAALVAAVNSRFPNIGELLLKRLVIQFKRGFKRNDKPICISSASFIAHLVNQRVAHEILALELLTLLVESPTDDSVEVAIAFLKECGQKLTEVSSKGVNAIFEMLRNILHEGQLDKRVQYMIEVMFQIWKDGFKDHPALVEGLELVPEEEQFTHLLMLDDATDSQDILNVFKFDEKYEENEQKYKNLSKEILGSDAESGDEDGSGSESGSGESEDEAEEGEEKPMTIIDNTETNLIALRRTIYLTINSSLDFEECAHKLMKMQLKPGQEVELCHMFLDCCAEQRTYEKFYGLLAQRFCNINRIYISPFEEIFKDSYSTAHRLDTNRLRNVSKFFAHLLFTDSISWEVLECVKLNEEDTTSSSRIYIKILFQELAEYMGLKKLNDRLKDPTLQGAFSGVFPRDNPKNTRFSINFFTSIGLGGLTDELREHLKQMPKNVPPAITEIKVASDTSSSSSDSSSSSSSSSDSSDTENEEANKKNKDKSKKKTEAPKTPEREAEAPKDKQERWGHDGFYETYGKDANRIDSRPPRLERGKDHFVIPKDPREQSRHERSARDNDKREKNGDERRHENDEPRSRRRETEREDDVDRRRDRRGNDYEASLKKDSESDRFRDRRNEDDSRSKRRESDRRDEKRNTENDDSRVKRREQDRDADRRTDKRSKDDDETEDHYSRSKRREYEKVDDKRTDRRNNDHDDSRSKKRDYEREDYRRTEKRNEEDNFHSKRKEQDRGDARKDRNKGNDSQSRRENDKESDRGREKRIEDHYKDKARDDVRDRRREDERIEVRESRKNKTTTTESEEDSKTKKKSKDIDSVTEQEKSRKKKKKKSKPSSEEEASSSDSEEDSKTKKKRKGIDSVTEQDKSRKKKKKKSKPSSDEESSSSDSEGDSKTKKKKKKSKKTKHEKENDWDIKNKRSLDKKTKTWKVGYNKDKVDTEEWDIERDESVNREIPDRYWDRQDFQKQESVKTSELSSKKRER